MPLPPLRVYGVALLGFGPAERAALVGFFGDEARGPPAYRLGDPLDESALVIADADNPAVLQAVLGACRSNDTVFIGAHAPKGALCGLCGPVHPVEVLDALDRLLDARRGSDGPTDDAASALAVAAEFGVDEEGDGPQAAMLAWCTPPVVASSAGREALVVDDSPIARRLLQQRLQRLGYRVRLAESVEQAVGLLMQHRFSLVFLDVVLREPGSRDGLELCQWLKRGKAAPCRDALVVMVTGASSALLRARAVLAGCDAYLTKPVREPEFLRTLERLGVALPAPLPILPPG